MNFDTAFNRIFTSEGGYSNDPNDPGGETKYGISKRSYPDLNIASLTRDDARAIYLRDFWSRINADRLPDGVAFQVFDFAVNSGIETAVRYLQRALGVADDGYWGPVTQTAANTMQESDIIMRFIAERLRFWTRLSGWQRYGKGWARRAANDLYYGAEDS